MEKKQTIKRMIQKPRALRKLKVKHPKKLNRILKKIIHRKKRD